MKITICGSMAFLKEMERVRDVLIQNEHDVKIPELMLETRARFGVGKTVSLGNYIEEKGGMDAFPPGHELWDLKESAIKDHFEKIDWADAILVVNEDKRGITGYIGGNTLIEIGLSYYLKKPIYIMNHVSSELSYKQEILGMKPIFLEGDLSKIT